MSYKSILEQTLERREPCEETLRIGWPEHRDLVEKCYPMVVAISERLFDGGAPILPVFVSATSPYGNAIGVCYLGDQGETGFRASRIWLKEADVRHGGWPLILLHESLHASLSWQGLKTDHNHAPWCSEIERISAMLGCPVQAKPIRAKRTGKKVAKHVEPGHLTQREIGRWPHDGTGITTERLRDFLGV